MPDLLLRLAIAAAVLVGGMTFAFIVRLATGRSGWIDVLWSLSVGAAGEVAIWAANNAISERAVLASALLAAWSLRLVAHIGRRSHGASDDPRYANLVAEWGRSWRSKLFGFLMAQAAAGWVLAMAVIMAATNPAPFPSLLDGAGLAIAAIALGGEATADRQLAQWRRTAPRNAICDVGLWRRSRHPNYFFEWLYWCSWPLLAANLQQPVAVAPALAAPLLMGHLLVNVSGVPPLEAYMAHTRGQAWFDYCARTPRFWPKL